MLRAGALLAASVALALLAARIGPDRVDAAAPAPSPFGDAFWKQWGDGQAELAGYDLTFSRYGEPRRGTAVAIFVTETFSNEARVKADPGKHAKSDEFPVMKLNLVQDFPTGIYDYNIMTSVFVALAPADGISTGTPAKISFSCQEWCGHVYEQSLYDAKSIRRTSHSYFDGEADRSATIERKAGRRRRGDDSLVGARIRGAVHGAGRVAHAPLSSIGAELTGPASSRGVDDSDIHTRGADADRRGSRRVVRVRDLERRRRRAARLDRRCGEGARRTASCAGRRRPAIARSFWRASA